MLEEFTSGGVEHQKSFWTANKCQCLTEVCKTVNLCRVHSLQRPATLIGSAGDQMDLAVRMW
jgi:hypothetical protein